MKSYKITLAVNKDIPEIVAFLSRPQIDNAFIYPLSQREVSISERVTSKFPDGFWLIARSRGKIVGVRGCKGIVDSQKRIVEFSTTAIDPDFRQSGLGTILIKRAVEIAFLRYQPLLMKLDSWSTNKAMEEAVKKVGFIRGHEYDDPQKRPLGVKSVEYLLDCTHMYSH